jgi:hypothetical protein
MKKVVVSVSTGKSRDLIKKSNKAEKKGEIIDWESIFNQVKELEAKKGEYIKAILEK